MTSAADFIALNARLRPGKLAACDLASGRRWTYAQLHLAVGRFAAALAARGIGRGERVAAIAGNCVDLVLLHHACARIGAIYVPLNWRLSRTELSWLLDDCEPALVTGDARLDAAEIEGLALDELAAEAARLDPMPDRPIDPDTPSLILYTSGTSGRPKGAVLNERNLAETAINFSLLGQVTPDSVFLADAPMFHVIGLVTNIRPAFMRGGTVMVSDGFIPARTLDRLGDPAIGATHYFCVPQMAAALRAEPGFDPARLSGLTALFTGGAPHPAADIAAWLDFGIPVADGFGMSEAGTVFGMPLDRDLIRERAGSAGLATPRVQTRIVDESGRECPLGEPGELLLRGDNIASGYWRRPEESQAAFVDGGWFRTGDIVRTDPEGYHWLVDRKKDMFISGGENVYPAEVEAALAGHPLVTECAVIGVPDARWGEVGHLFVALARDAAADRDGQTAREEILSSLSAVLAKFKIPKHVSLVDALPRNGAGKVLKGELRALARMEDA
ncbi:AMP-binding protein [Marinicauda pacifica]|uniref:AMP-binding protein n=1 Tax=Marinicauda pacifica TaxID=1133559 RepID=UPI0035C840F7